MISNKIKIYLFLFIFISLLLIYARLHIGGGIPGGDSIRYYSYLQTIVINHNLDFTPAFDYFHGTKSQFTGLVKLPQLPDKHPLTGYYIMHYPIGVLLSWLPFFLFGHLLALIIHLFHPDPSLLSGFSMVHYFFTSISSLFYLLAGCYLAYRYFVNYLATSKLSAFLAVATIGLGSSLTYYVYFVPTYSHLVSFFWSTWFLTYTLGALQDRRFLPKTFLFAGFLLAMTALSRYQDILIVLVPLYLLLKSKEFKSQWFQFLKLSWLSLLSFLLVFIPQFLVNRYLHGAWLKSGYNEQGFSFWNHPQFLYVLFSPIKGLFVITPIILISLLSLVYHYKNRLYQAFLLSFLLQLYVIASWVAYHQGESYGIRMLTSLSLIFMVGLLPIFNYLQSRRLSWAWTFSALFIMINWVLMFLFAIRIFGSPYDAQF
jgi:hypothetical protein